MANDTFWEQLDGLDGQKTAKRAGCKYLEQPERYLITFLGAEHIVNLADKKIYTAATCSTQETAGFLAELVILAYLVHARELPLADMARTRSAGVNKPFNCI